MEPVLELFLSYLATCPQALSSARPTAIQHLYCHGPHHAGVTLHGAGFTPTIPKNPFLCDRMVWEYASTHHIRFSTAPLQCFDIHWSRLEDMLLRISFCGDGFADVKGVELDGMSPAGVRTLVERLQGFLLQADALFDAVMENGLDYHHESFGEKGHVLFAYIPSISAHRKLTCRIEHSFLDWKHVSLLVDIWKDICDELQNIVRGPCAELWGHNLIDVYVCSLYNAIGYLSAYAFLSPISCVISRTKQ
jgi:hypothetical protein